MLPYLGLSTGDKFWDNWNRRVYKSRSRELASIIDKHMNSPRNSPCPCGSGIKYKKCHRSRFNLNIGDMSIMMNELGLNHRYVLTQEQIKQYKLEYKL